MRRRRGLVVVIVPMLFGSCAPAAVQETPAALQRIDEQLRQCSARHGYDPALASTLGPNALGVGEQGWRECAYRAVQQHLIPRSSAPELYRQLIAEDREMTARIGAGTLTRAERRARLQAALEEIDRRERATADRALTDLARREQELMRQRDLRGAVMQPFAR